MKKSAVVFGILAIFLTGIVFLLSGSTQSSAQLNVKTFTPTNIYKSPTPSPIKVLAPTSRALTPTPAPGTTAPTGKCEVADTKKIVDSITEANIREYIMNLVDDDLRPGHDELQTRATGTSGNRVEADYIVSHYNKFGIENSFQLVPSISSNNIIAKIAGKKENEVYIITGHFDSVTTGAADDNGSGTAVVMEAARAIRESGLCPNYTIEFIDFTGEELGLLGSIYYVNSLPAGKVVRGVINLDMVANPAQTGDCVNFVSARYNPGENIGKKAEEIDIKYGIGLNVRAASGSIGASDHYPFEVRGYPAVFGTECRFNTPVYHTPQDTSDKVDYGQVAATAKVVAGTIAELAAGN